MVQGGSITCQNDFNAFEMSSCLVFLVAAQCRLHHPASKEALGKRRQVLQPVTFAQISWYFPADKGELLTSCRAVVQGHDFQARDLCHFMRNYRLTLAEVFAEVS